jgi:hypothetical protein
MRKFWPLFLLAVVSVAIGSVSSADYQQKEGSFASASSVSGMKNGKCVEPTAVMRRGHMDFLFHQRDETMHRGIRTESHSLKGCVDCHEKLLRREGRLVSSDTPVSVNDPEGGFCQGCHQYAAVSIDCFQCHVATTVSHAKK